VLVQIPIQAKYYYKRRRYLHSDDTGIYCKLNHSQLKAPPVDGSPERCRITSGQEGISEAGHLPQGRIGAAGPAAGHLDVRFLCKILVRLACWSGDVHVVANSNAFANWPALGSLCASVVCCGAMYPF